MRQSRAALSMSWFTFLDAIFCAGLWACTPNGALPPSPSSTTSDIAPSGVEASIARQPICVGSSVLSAGSIADTLYYRAVSLQGGKIAVGYFVFFSEERPWGNNWLTWTVLPALGVDMFYSRSLLVAPGIQRALYGKGDVEGFRIIYELQSDGSLRADSAVADDRDERPVALGREQLFALDAQRPTLYTDIWSHQLGGRDAHSKADLSSLHCYEADQIRPLTDDIASDFHVENRANPAHVELLGGVSLHDEAQQAKSSSPPPPRGTNAVAGGA